MIKKEIKKGAKNPYPFHNVTVYANNKMLDITMEWESTHEDSKFPKSEIYKLGFAVAFPEKYTEEEKIKIQEKIKIALGDEK